MLTPLHLACWYGQESVVKLMLEHGADVNATDKVSLKSTSYLISAHGSVPRKTTPMLHCGFMDQRVIFMKIIIVSIRILSWILIYARGC